MKIEELFEWLEHVGFQKRSPVSNFSYWKYKYVYPTLTVEIRIRERSLDYGDMMINNTCTSTEYRDSYANLVKHIQCELDNIQYQKFKEFYENEIS